MENLVQKGLSSYMYYENKLGSTLDSIIYYDSILAKIEVDSLSSSDTSLFNSTNNYYIDLYNSTFNDKLYFDSLLVHLDSLVVKRKDSILSVAEEELARILCNHNYEDNLKYLLARTIEYNLSDFDTFTNGQRSVIDSLAKECPQIEGNGVYYARHLTGMRDTLEYTFCIPENNELAEWQPMETVDVRSSVYPNPARDHLTISYLGEDAVTKAYIYSNTGRSVRVLDISDQVLLNFNINIADLAPGAYYLGVGYESGYFETHKFIVVQ